MSSHAGTGKLLNRKQLIGEKVFAIVCVVCHCNVTLSKNRLAEAQMYMYYTDQPLGTKLLPSTQHKKQKIQKTPPHYLKSETKNQTFKKFLIKRQRCMPEKSIDH